MKQIWRTIPQDTAYQVSDHGRVRRLATVLSIPGPRASLRRLPPRTLKPFLHSGGYLQVCLPHLRKITVHRLVAIVFLGEPTFRSQGKRGKKAAHVNHIDNDKTNNRLSNLEWVTARQNILHSFRTTSRRGSFKGKFGRLNPSSIPVIATCLRTGKERRYAAAADAVRKGFSSGGISHACRGKIAAHRGYRWRYERGHGRGVVVGE